MVVGDLPTEVDLVILGAGPGGCAAALRAAELGREVVLVDPKLPGGRCLHDHCTPATSLWQAAVQSRRLEDLSAMGIELTRSAVELARLQQRKETVVARQAEEMGQQLRDAGVELLQGRGWFLNERELRVETPYNAPRYQFDACIIATGATPRPLPDHPFDGSAVLTPAQAISLDRLPNAVDVFGADPVAGQVATIFGALGAHVRILLPPGQGFLADFEPDAVTLVRQSLAHWQITFAEPPHPALEPSTEHPLIVSLGSQPDAADLALQEAAIAQDPDGCVLVDERLTTSNSAVLAVGDVTGGPALASLAKFQGRLAAESATNRPVSYAPQAVPQVVWTYPQLAQVGLHGRQAKALGYKVSSEEITLPADNWPGGLEETNGAIFLTAEADTGVLLGGTVVAPQAEALISELALALEMGATLDDLAATVHPHPSLSEAWQEAAARSVEALKR